MLFKKLSSYLERSNNCLLQIEIALQNNYCFNNQFIYRFILINFTACCFPSEEPVST